MVLIAIVRLSVNVGVTVVGPDEAFLTRLRAESDTGCGLTGVS